MEQYLKDQAAKDPLLWSIAKKRAGFQVDLVIYLVVNAFLWLVWLLSIKNYSGGVPWPVWPTAGWGIAIFFQYLEAYSYPKEELAEREYEKLKEQYK